MTVTEATLRLSEAVRLLRRSDRALDQWPTAPKALREDAKACLNKHLEGDPIVIEPDITQECDRMMIDKLSEERDKLLAKLDSVKETYRKVDLEIREKKRRAQDATDLLDRVKFSGLIVKPSYSTLSNDIDNFLVGYAGMSSVAELRDPTKRKPYIAYNPNDPDDVEQIREYQAGQAIKALQEDEDIKPKPAWSMFIESAKTSQHLMDDLNLSTLAAINIACATAICMAVEAKE